MPKGPHINDISKNFTTRDSLGVEGVATSMQAEICPIVNTVTPRAFYWPFMIWIYYDFYKYSGIEERTVKEFDKYLKRQDYFFVLATLLTPGADQSNLVGKQQSQIDIDNNPNGPYRFNKDYFKSRYGGMQYYNAGCLSMYFITDKDLANDRDLSFPALRPEGEKMAKAFETIIKDTAYYKSFRCNDEPVPRSVLEEYGEVINLGLVGFDECKSLLKRYMFEDDRAIQLIERSALLKECADYIKLIFSKGRITVNTPLFRRILYDHELESGKKLSIPNELKIVAHKWELVIGRMYFTAGLGMIWKYMLEQLNSPYTVKEWINQTINATDFKWNLKDKISDIIAECEYGFDVREDMFNATAQSNTSSYSVENGLKMMLSVYNRFACRESIDIDKEFLGKGMDSQSISLSEFFETVDEYRDKTIKELLIFVMQSWLINQHYLTAFNKMLQGRDGFYYETFDGKYVRKHEFGLFFQGIRMVQLTQVMMDLDML